MAIHRTGLIVVAACGAIGHKVIGMPHGAGEALGVTDGYHFFRLFLTTARIEELGC